MAVKAIDHNIQEIAKIEEELARRERENKCKYYTPTGKQEEFIRLYSTEGLFINIYSGGNGAGKCLPLYAPILMADGSYRSLEGVREGDYVIGHNYDSGIAEPTRVIGVSRAGLKEVYRIRFKDGSFVVASAEHSFPMKLKSGRKSYIKKRRIEEVVGRRNNCIGGRLKFVQPKFTIFTPKKNRLNPYLLGALIGDGGLTGRGIRFSNKGDEVLDKLRSILEPLGYRLNKEIGDNVDYRIGCGEQGANPLLKEIRRLKLNVKSGEKFIPNSYKTASIEDRLQLLAGLIDTDGSKNEFSSKSKRLAEDFVFVVRSLGGHAKLSEKTVNNKFTKNIDKTYYRVYWKFDYKLPLQLSYKQKISKRPVEYSNRFVESIEKIGKVECGDIWVEHPYHCYLSYDFISTGNTATATNIIINECLGHRNKWFNYPRFDTNKRPTKKNHKILIASTSEGIEDVINPTLAAWLPKGTYTRAKKGKTYYSHYQVFSHDIKLMTYEQEVTEYEGKTLSLAWFDEPPPEKIFNAVIARFRFGGKIIISMTPLQHAAYLYDLIGKNADIGIVYADIEDSCKIHGVRGYLEHEDIQRMVQQYPEEERSARKEGKFMHLKGLVFKEFAPIHIANEFKIPALWRRYMAVDPHDRVHNFVLWGALDPTGDFYVYDEDWTTDLLTKLAEKIKEHEGTYGRANVRLIDPNFGKKRYGNSGKTVRQELEEAGRAIGIDMRFKLANDDITAGHKKVHEYMYYDAKKPVDMRNHPKLYIFPRCKNLIYMLKHYMFQDWKEGTGLNKSPNPKPEDKFKHGPDCLRYMLMDNPTVVVPKMRKPRGSYGQ